MPINSVAGTPTTRGGKLARAARMWWTPDQGGLRPEYRVQELREIAARQSPDLAKELRRLADMLDRPNR
jgi:hypothetical protein